MLYQLSYFRISPASGEAGIRFSDGKDSEQPFIEKIFPLFVFGGIQRTFLDFHLWFSLVAHGVQAIAAAQHESSKSEELNMKEKATGSYPVPAKVRMVRVGMLIFLHT